jgi:nucleoside-diphosphate-sugar epimerase
MRVHLVIGYGPAGAETARLLAKQGNSVRVITKSARAAEPGIEHLTLDAADGGQLAKAAEGASVIYNCASPPYHRWTRDWPALAEAVGAAAESTGAVLVVLSNLYGYGPADGVLSEDLPLNAPGGKGRTRAAAWQQTLNLHQQGRIRAVELRASDFFGPGVTENGHLASRVMPPLLRGRTVRVLGDPDTAHSWTYLPDGAAALVRVGQEEGAWGRPWHVPTEPPQSIRVMAGKLAAQAGVPAAEVRRLSPGLVRALGLASPLLRELQEVRYQFDQPFIIDSTAYTARFGVTATPLEEQVKSTVSWWQQRLA